MTQKFIQLFTVGLLFLLSTTAVLSQQRISSPVGPPENWVRPFEGFRIIGNLYGVGSYDLSVFLITTEDGHILINTGLADSTQMIRSNIESLGFKLEDIKILLTQQAHWDHTAALSEIKEITGAETVSYTHLTLPTKA